jgi:hypothetical protein
VRLVLAVVFLAVATIAACGAVTIAFGREERLAARIGGAVVCAIATAGCVIAAVSVMG